MASSSKTFKSTDSATSTNYRPVSNERVPRRQTARREWLARLGGNQDESRV